MHDTHLAELMAQRTTLDAQIAEAKVAHMRDATKQLIDVCNTFGITAEEAGRALLGNRKKPKVSTGKKVAPKYQDSATGATWTGRGKSPTWFSQERVDNGDIAVLR